MIRVRKDILRGIRKEIRKVQPLSDESCLWYMGYMVQTSSRDTKTAF